MAPGTKNEARRVEPASGRRNRGRPGPAIGTWEDRHRGGTTRDTMQDVETRPQGTRAKTGAADAAQPGSPPSRMEQTDAKRAETCFPLTPTLFPSDTTGTRQLQSPPTKTHEQMDTQGGQGGGAEKDSTRTRWVSKAALPGYADRYNLTGLAKGPLRYRPASRVRTEQLLQTAPGLLKSPLALDIQELIRRQTSKSKKVNTFLLTQ